MKKFLLVLLTVVGTTLQAQNSNIQFFRPAGQAGLHVFETTKVDTVPYEGIRVRIGGNFTQDFQALKHENQATPVEVGGVNTNQLIKLAPGFNLAMANLNIDAQIADGVRVNLTMYLSARHHNETWVKGGYVQMDKLPFLRNETVDRIMESFTIRVGNYELDYGDQHYRRSDGGNTSYNPFVENYIMDAFATEVGGEVYYHPENGVIAMLGITNGQLNPTVIQASAIDSLTGEVNKYPAAFHGKLGYDKQLNSDLRVRLTGSFYAVKSSSGATLFWGDRTGSHYYLALENSKGTVTANAWSGRFNPSFKQQIATFVINPFIKYKGLELFATYEIAKGRNINEKELRTATQYAAELIYRFPAKENFWIGGRFNSVTATMPGVANDITISRATGSAGWFVTQNMILKLEYVNQTYKDFSATDIRSNGKFSGLMVEAALGF